MMSCSDYIRSVGGEDILFPEDVPGLLRSEACIYGLMRDGQWHLASRIRLAAGDGIHEASEGLRRMRRLRTLGFRIERQRNGLCRQWMYRIIGYDPPETPQMERLIAS